MYPVRQIESGSPDSPSVTTSGTSILLSASSTPVFKFPSGSQPAITHSLLPGLSGRVPMGKLEYDPFFFLIVIAIIHDDERDNCHEFIMTID